MYDELIARLREADEKSMCGECGLNLHTGATKKGVLFAEAADAIEELQQIAAHYEETAHDYFKDVCYYLERMPKWIPVTERLPKKEWKIYWICTDSGYQCECRWTKNKYGLGESDNWGWHIMDIPQYQKVIAWRELPEPYEPPKEE